jgi:hypothetical protein
VIVGIYHQRGYLLTPRAKTLGQVADLGFWVATVAAPGVQEGSLPSLAQRDTVLGETWRRSATWAVWRRG